MRKVTEQIVRAFLRGESRTISNSRTENNRLYLFNNLIAEYRGGNLWITNAGWASKTTKERLNGLSGVNIQQKRGEWYLNGVQWDGEWVEVATWGEWASPAPAEEVEFDMTSEWTGKYSKPNYSVFHTNNVTELDAVESLLSDIPHRRSESDTAGKWLPNYFIIVLPQDYEKATKLLTHGA